MSAPPLLPDGRPIDRDTGAVGERAVSPATAATVLALSGAAAALGARIGEARNAAQWRRTLAKLEQARGERDALRARLEHGWRWFARHADDPRFAAYEERWLGWETDYRAVCDAIAQAERRLLT